MGVIAEAMAAFVLADALVEKFGSDSLAELQRNLDAYLEPGDVDEAMNARLVGPAEEICCLELSEELEL